MELPPQSRIGSFKIISLVGKGGMGTVYQARDLALGRDVAIKVLDSDRTSDPSRLERFKRDARSASSLNHPNITSSQGRCLALPLIPPAKHNNPKKMQRNMNAGVVLRSSISKPHGLRPTTHSNAK